MNENVVSSVLHAARLLFQPGDVLEIRVPKARTQKVIFGYFDDFQRLAEEVARLESGKYPGIYWTLNPVNRALLARANNNIKPFATDTTKDDQVVRRHWLPVDLDPKRPTGISSTDPEHDAALELGQRIMADLAAAAWSEPIYADSGNGAHLLYPIDLPNDVDSADLVHSALLALSARYDVAGAMEVDKATFNASRIMKVYGTTARKGDSTGDRPHRVARILQVPALLTPIPVELLRQLAATAPADAKRPVSRPVARMGGARSRPFSGEKFDVAAFLDRFGIRHRAPAPYDGGYKYVLDECPFDPAHGHDSMVWEGAEGRLGFHCLHNGCHGRQWRDFRNLFEPNRPQGPYPPPIPWPEAATARSGSRADDPAAPLEESDTGDKNLALSAADVEAAVNVACEANDLAGALKLIPEIARLPLQSLALIEGMLRKKFKRDFPLRNFTRAIKEEQDEMKKKQTPPPADYDDLPAAEGPSLISYPLTDSGNGERLRVLYGEDIRFCPEFKKWLLWDGCRWRIDTDAATVTQFAKNMVRLLHDQAKALALEDGPLCKLVQQHARASESQAGISACLLRAKSEPGMALSASDLDQHRYLLNCINGVVDVRTGALLPFERRYYITKLCHVKYNPESIATRDCPRFLKLLHWTMGETADMGELPAKVTRMVDFLQKSFGYALTGDVSEKAAFIFYGAKGNNGKTTLLTIFKSILSEYATQLDINTLMTSKFTDNNVRADLAKLHGARFVITSEVDDGQRLSERLMKYLTAGMGEITACRKFENPFEFKATHKIWMDCNYRPEIKGADEAIWSRLKCVPFLQRIDKNDPEIDKQLLEKILAESEGVLAWAVRGAMRWVKEQGLGDPPEVAEAGAEWREADDPLRGFFDECCEVDVTDPDYHYVRCADFTKAYQAYCKDNNEQQLKSSRLTQRLELKGGIKLNRSRRISANGKQARCWDGIRLKEDVTQVFGPRGSFVTNES